MLGGTRFIGKRAVTALLARGHEVAVCHRGDTEPDDLTELDHLHFDRKDLADHRHDVAAWRPDAVIDCLAMTPADADAALAAIPNGIRTIVLSSQDVYRAFGSINDGAITDEMPVDEASAVRAERFYYRGVMPGGDDYSKLEVEDRFLARGGVALRLPMVYGEGDGQRREEFILRRVRAGRNRIPTGAGCGLLPRGYVGDVAEAIACAVEGDGIEGEIFNVCETRSAPLGLWARQILAAAGSTAELVRVPDDALPPDLGLLGAIPQPFLASNEKARTRLGWKDTDALAALAASVTWHLANPPTYPDGADPGFEADDTALAMAPS
jgi:UDP-glucose 4-epimerase